MMAKVNEEISDPELWEQVRNGDEAALEMLYKRHYQALYRYAMKLARDKDMALDCLQEMFFQLWAKRENLKAVQSVRFYLMKWLKREILKTLNGKHNGNNIISIDNDTESMQLEAEDLIEFNEANKHNAAQIRKALATLTAREREVIYMRFFLELTYEEICAAMNLSYQVIMNYVHRALKALRSNEFINKIVGLWLVILSYWT